ncbi:hypothetical protein ACOBV8_19885 (plasmid) [Pseudoalteromonas espejiana]
MNKQDVYLNASRVLSAPLSNKTSSVVSTVEDESVAFKSFREEINCSDFAGILSYFDAVLYPLLKS